MDLFARKPLFGARLNPVYAVTETIIIMTFGFSQINRGSYMSTNVLLNSLNELGKSHKMRGLPGHFIVCFFSNEFNKFNNTGERMLDFIYHMSTQRYYGRHFIHVTLGGFPLNISPLPTVQNSS